MLNKVGLNGPTEDCSVTELSNGKQLLTTVDIFTPIHDDPIIMGKIAACNVTNDIFAKNVLDIINYLSFLGVPNNQPEQITEGLLQGQREFLKQFNADINGGHSIVNPWPLIGGMATGISDKDNIVSKQIDEQAKLGDFILTKPMGIQPAMAVYRIQKDQPDFLGSYNPKSLEAMVNTAVECMTTSNYGVVKAIHDENLRSVIAGMTDVTGFGLKGHALEMIEGRKLNIEIDILPVIQGTIELSSYLGYDLLSGSCAETAGAMLIAIDSNKIRSEEFQNHLSHHGVMSWRIGRFLKGTNQFTIIQNHKVIEVESLKPTTPKNQKMTNTIKKTEK
jgi:selenide,water dikinase